jgi:hypothetical protein
MSGFERIKSDFQQGKNLDIYVTIVIALVVSVLSFFEILPNSKVSSLLLAVLAILAFNALQTRVAVEGASFQQGRGPEFLDDFPAELRQHRESAKDLYLIGVGLTRTIETSYTAFERSLKRGARIRVLLTDLSADPAALDAQSQPSRPSAEEIASEIKQSLGRLGKLKEATQGNLSVRTTRSALKFGLNFIDPSSSNATLYVQLYSYRLGGESRPIFVITQRHGEWLECFRHQAEALWSDAVEYDFGKAER